ncbi:PspC domain-containing protein [Secundilactobacillus kimchicus]|nr:PspC domain-containing protein [Secundilactobacillus kimchicus]
MQKRLVKSSDKMIAGVLGGLANYFGWDPTIVRIGYAALTIFTGIAPGALVYLVALVVMPND